MGKMMTQALFVDTHFVIVTIEGLTLRSGLKMAEKLGYRSFWIESIAQSIFRIIISFNLENLHWCFAGRNI